MDWISKPLKTIHEQLELEIPHGVWCNKGIRPDWCPYFRVIGLRGYCDLCEEFTEMKSCGINEE